MNLIIVPLDLAEKNISFNKMNKPYIERPWLDSDI